MANDKLKLTLEVDAKQGINEVNNLKKSINETGDAAKSSGGGLGAFTNKLSAMGGPIGMVINGMKATIKQMWLMVTNPLGAVIAGIVLAVTALYKIFSSFSPVVKLVEQGMAAVGAVLDVVKNTVIALFTGAKNLKEAFSGLGGRMKQAAQDAANLKKAMQDLSGAQTRAEVSTAKLQTQINELILQSKNRTLSEQERIALIDKALKLEEEQFNIEKANADEQLRIAQEVIAQKARAAGVSDFSIEKLQEEGVAYAQQLKKKINLGKEEIDALVSASVKEEEINQKSIALREKALNRKDALEDKAAADAITRQEKAEENAKKATEAEAKRIEDEKKLYEERNAALTQSILDDLEANTLRLQNAGATEKEILDAQIARIEAEQSLYQEGSLKWEQLQAQKLKLVQDFNQKEVDAANKKYKELNDALTKSILDDLNVETLRLQNAGATDQQILDSKIATIEAQQALEEEGSLKWEELQQQKLQLQADFDSQELQKDEEKRAKKVAIAQATFDGISKIMSALGAFYDAQMNKELEAAGENEAEKDKIRKEYAKKKKRMAYIQAIIDTASAVMQALSSMPPPISYIMAAVSAAAGAIQIATISKQQFAKGGILRGPSHANGGILTPYGELEGGEGVINKNSMLNPNLRNLASSINVAGGGRSFGSGDGSVKLSTDSIGMIIAGISGSVNDKKVYVSESDISSTQKKVAVYETNSTL